MLDPPAIGFQGRGFLMARALGQIEINQLAECERLALFPPRRCRIAAGRDLGEQAFCFCSRRLGRPRRTVLANR